MASSPRHAQVERNEVELLTADVLSGGRLALDGNPFLGTRLGYKTSGLWGGEHAEGFDVAMTGGLRIE